MKRVLSFGSVICKLYIFTKVKKIPMNLDENSTRDSVSFQLRIILNIFTVLLSNGFQRPIYGNLYGRKTELTQSVIFTQAHNVVHIL